MNSNWKFFVFFSSHLQLTNTNTSGIVKYGSISAFAPITTDHVDTLAVGTCVNAEFSTFVNVLANICSRVQLRSSWTDALRYQKRLRFLWWTNQLDFVFFFYLETSRCVTTLSSITKKIVDGAFVYVRASFTRTINLISRIANTTICSQQVLASSNGANIWILGAFVNICSVKSSKFCYQCFILISITY